MKIVLVNPPYTNFEGMKESGGHMMPLNLAYLAAYLRQRINCKIAILDAEVQGLNYQQIKRSLKREKPDLVGLTCPTPTMKHVYQIVGMVKKELSPNCKTVLGGIHPTALPWETIANSYVDFLVIGEGEVTFFELVESLIDKAKDFSHIDGLFFKRKGKIVTTKARRQIEDLDSIPFPARDLFDLNIYYQSPSKKVSSERAGPILTSRGCAFCCTHCISQKMWGRKVRFRSPENVIEEMEECITKYGIKEFNIFDDTFTLDQRRAMRICDLMIAKKLPIHWNALSRVNTISKDLVIRMKEAGCGKISFGLESGSQRILDLMRKKATIGMAKKSVEMVAGQGIAVHASFMLGNIGETEKTIQQTINFAKQLPLDVATFFITTPYPGTDLYEISKRDGLLKSDIPWEEFAPLTNTSPILVQKNVAKERLVYWQKRAFREFYLRPNYIVRKIGQIRSLSSVGMLLEGFRVLQRILVKRLDSY